MTVFAPLPPGPFSVVVADPPWPEKGPMHLPSATKDLPKLGTPYAQLSYEQIAGLDVAGCVASESHLYLWATQRSLRKAFEISEAWGFEVKAALTWAKSGLGMGFRYFRHSSEFVVFAVRGNLPVLTNNVGTWFTGKKGPHSAKPPEFFQMVERCSPGPRLELFARTAREGWTCWGDEAP